MALQRIEVNWVGLEFEFFIAFDFLISVLFVLFLHCKFNALFLIMQI